MAFGAGSLRIHLAVFPSVLNACLPGILFSCSHSALVTDICWAAPQITLTTHPDGSAGFLVYVDGTLAASLPGTGPNAVNATLANPNLLLDGGRPIFMEVSTCASRHSSSSLCTCCPVPYGIQDTMPAQELHQHAA